MGYSSEWHGRLRRDCFERSRSRIVSGLLRCAGHQFLGYDGTGSVMGLGELRQEFLCPLQLGQTSQRLQVLAVGGCCQGAELRTARFQSVCGLVERQRVLTPYGRSYLFDQATGILEIGGQFAGQKIRMAWTLRCLNL